MAKGCTFFVAAFFYSGVNTTPENERVKALSEACLDRSYLGFITNPKNGEVKALSVRVP